MTGCFLLQRPVARRPAPRRSAARGVSTGVTSRGTPGRAVKGSQPVVPQVDGRIEIPIHLQPAGRAAKHAPAERHLPVSMPAARAKLSGREASRCHDEPRPVPGALVFQQPPEGSPSHILDGPGKAPVPRQTPHIQVLHHQNRLGFRQLGGDFVQEIPADVAHPTVQPDQTQRGLLVVAREDRPLSFLPRLRVLFHHLSLIHI